MTQKKKRPMAADKSAGKSAPGKPFTGANDPRNGRGPKRGAPNAGRPPEWIRDLARGGLASTVPELRRIVERKRSTDRDRIRAIQALHDISGMKRLELTGPQGSVFPQLRVVIEGAP